MYKLNSGFLTQKIGKKTTIFSGEKSILFTLNETAAYIFNGLKLGWSEEKIIDRMIEKFDVSKPEIAQDMKELKTELLSKNILVKV